MIVFSIYYFFIAGKDLEVLEARRKLAMQKNQDLSQLDSYIEDIKENINYVQETIAETQHNVMEIEENQDNSDNQDLQNIVDTICDMEEAKYLLKKLYLMTLSQSHAVAQRDAKLKESEATLQEVNTALNL